MPVLIGKSGVEKVLEIELSDSEREALNVSAGKVQEIIATLG